MQRWGCGGWGGGLRIVFSARSLGVCPLELLKDYNLARRALKPECKNWLSGDGNQLALGSGSKM